MTKEPTGSEKVSEKLRSPLSRVVAASLLLWPLSPLGAAESGGDYHVNASGTQEGNLSVDGSIDVAGDGDFGGFLQLGSTLEESAFPALKLSYTEDALGASAAMSARRPGVSFLWEDNLTGASKRKMKLSGDNVLTLFDSNGNASLVLSPASGIALTAGKSLTLSDGTVLSGAGSLKSSALYDSAGNARLWLDSNNNLVVSTPTSFTSDATFAQGVKFPNGEVINEQSAANLNKLLQNFGYNRETGVETAPIAVSSPSNIRIEKAAMAGTQVEAAIAFQESVRWTSGIYTGGYNANAGVVLGYFGLTDKGVFNQIAGFLSTGSVSIPDFTNSPNRVVVGRFSGTLTMPGTISGSWSASNSDYFVASIGYPRWIRILSSAAYDYDNVQIGQDSGGNVYVVGPYSAPLSYGGSSPLAASGQNDVFIIKYSPSGTVVWAKSLSGSGDDKASDIVVLPDDSIVISGSTSGSLPFGSVGTISNAGFVTKLSANGDFQWVVSLSSPSGSILSLKLANGSSGSVWVSGSFPESMTALGTSNTASQCVTTSVGATQGDGYDGFLTKVLSNGNVQSIQPFGGDTAGWGYQYNVSPIGIAVADSGDVYVLAQRDWWWYESSDSNSVLFRLSGTATEYREYPSPIQAVLAGNGKLGFVSNFSENKFVGGVVVPAGGAVYLGPQGNLPAGEAPIDSAPLLWTQAEAANGAIALGGLAYAVGDGSSAFGNSNSFGSYSFSAGKSEATGQYSTSFGLSSASAIGTTAGGDSSASGSYSTAFGDSAAKGNYSLGVGYSLASGEGAFSAGYATQATGAYSVALGNGSIASGPNAFAMGNASKASGDRSAAFGNSIASGTSSSAFGMSTASGINSFSIGQGKAVGNDSVALGAGTAEGTRSLVFSTAYDVSQAVGFGSVAIGEGLVVRTPGTFVTGRYNIDEVPRNTLEDPAFIVGTGEYISPEEEDAFPYAVRKNAFVVRKNGDVEMNGKVKLPRQGDILMGEFGNPE